MKSAVQKFNIVSLGCARNLVDSEVMAGLLERNRYVMVPQPEEADIVVINTCGFIDAAKTESIDTIVEVARLKETGKLKKLVVAGCLSQRYPEELASELSEVDRHFVQPVSARLISDYPHCNLRSQAGDL